MASESSEDDFSEPSLLNYNASSDEYVPAESDFSGQFFNLGPWP